jgi:uncharacterized protein (TIGR00303 family)
MDHYWIGVGLRVWPDLPIHRVPSAPGGSIVRGKAVPGARALWSEGERLGRELADGRPYLVLGESVPGGTTTALSLLLALGVDAAGRVSGSSQDNAHALKHRVAMAALKAAGMTPGDGQRDPLGAAAAVGDPMQPLVAGMCMGSARIGVPVLLAGGSQMVAVAALIRAAHGASGLEKLAVATTRWVVDDPAADVAGLAHDVDANLALMAANVDFSTSRHPGLRAYERPMVKEGVGAGGACIAALLTGRVDRPGLHEAIDRTYDTLLGAGEPPLDNEAGECLPKASILSV